MRSTRLPKLPELADHLTRGVAIVRTSGGYPARRAGELLEGNVCLDSVDTGTSANRFAWEKGSEKLGFEQCEICARWTWDVAYVPGRCLDSASNKSSTQKGHFVCGHCEREAVANSFVRQTLKNWLRGKWQKWRRRTKVRTGRARCPDFRLDLSRPLRGRGVNSASNFCSRDKPHLSNLEEEGGRLENA
jgi:hypothetical protein